MSAEEKNDKVVTENVEEKPQDAVEQPENPETGEDKAEVAETAETAPEAEEKAPEEPLMKEGEMDTPVDEESAKRIGVKETAQNAEVMSMEKEAADEDGEKIEMAIPSFFIDTEKRHRVAVDILCSSKDGSVLSVSRTGIGIDYKEFEYLNHVKEWFEFTLPSYEEMSTYRQRCGVYRKEAQQVIIDRLQLRNFLLVWHLKDWSLRDGEGKKVELSHEENGALDDQTMKVVYKTHTTILDVVLTILEKDILLT